MIIIGTVLSVFRPRLLLLAAVHARRLRTPVLRRRHRRARRLPLRVGRDRRDHCRRPRRRRDPCDRTNRFRDSSIAAPPHSNRAPLCRAGHDRRIPGDAWTRAYRRAGRKLARGLRGGGRYSDRRHGLGAHDAVHPAERETAGRGRSGIAFAGRRDQRRVSQHLIVDQLDIGAMTGSSA